MSLMKDILNGNWVDLKKRVEADAATIINNKIQEKKLLDKLEANFDRKINELKYHVHNLRGKK